MPTQARTTVPEYEWQFWIDVGGTFTDCIAQDRQGRRHQTKILSSGVIKGRLANGIVGDRLVQARLAGKAAGFWRDYQLSAIDGDGTVVDRVQIQAYDPDQGAIGFARPIEAPAATSYELHGGEEAPILAIRDVLDLSLADQIPPVDIRLGTTRGTNALLTRRGSPTGFLVTQGFGDCLSIGTQQRPHLFQLDIRKPAPLYEMVREVRERITTNGEVLVPLDRELARQQLNELRESGIRSVAICLMHADRFPAHEEQLAKLAAEFDFDDVSVSHQVSPLIKLVTRGETTVLDAYLNPVLRCYVNELRRSLGNDTRLRLMTSAGGLASEESFSGKDSLLSGPAGGVVGFSSVARQAGFRRSIGLDMGGTSSDVSRFDSGFEMVYESELAGIRVSTPRLDIETVAAGGGSICYFDGVKLAVGPQSATSDPGPACYGRGGPLTITDVNLFLGRIHADRFPWELDVSLVDSRLAEIGEQVAATTGRELSADELAEGFLQIANLNMANAIRSISVAQGYDPRDYVLVCFGGAAPQHACAVAEELGMDRILNHPLGGVLSAVGIGMADLAAHRVQGIYEPWHARDRDHDRAQLDELCEQAASDLNAQGVNPGEMRFTRQLELRYEGTNSSLMLTFDQQPPCEDDFHQLHVRRFGYRLERPLELVALRVEASGGGHSASPLDEQGEVRDRTVQATSTLRHRGEEVGLPIIDRNDLSPGDRLVGPLLISEPLSTTVIDVGWRVTVLPERLLLLERVESLSSEASSHAADDWQIDSPAPKDNAPRWDPIRLEVFNNHFEAIASQMGEALRKTAISVNVKERLDFSCALFTPTGDLVVNAPHIPVHLGAMSETVKCLIADRSDLAAGDVIVTNDPFRGGSHLPDITVITPVFDASDRQVIFFVASRAHHAEIGGITPGSMPPQSRSLAEEGVLLTQVKVIEQGQERFDALERLLTQGDFPSRAPQENLADIRAQIAANQQGVVGLKELVDRYSLPTVQAYMEHIQTAAEEKLRSCLQDMPSGRRTFQDAMDDGTPIVVSLEISEDHMVCDFQGTGDVHAGNLNANRSITTAALLYAVRCLVDEEIPLNQGLLNPIELLLPSGLLNPPIGMDDLHKPAVVGGNVETSQRIVDVLLGALGLAAASQGTMNNLLFGDESFGYYETICGGAGATPRCNGADAVHTHMTNTRLTDPEILEQRFPVRLWQFKIRRGSGGQGAYRGGDGVIREIEFLRPLEVSLLSQRRCLPGPFGMQGGQPGKIGINRWIHSNQKEEMIPGQAVFQVAPGDRIVIETPGGGGWGKAE